MMLFCTFLWSFSRCVSGRQLCAIFADFGCLAGSLSAPVGSHYSSCSATDFQPIFKVRFHHIYAPPGDAQWKTAARAQTLWGAGKTPFGLRK